MYSAIRVVRSLATARSSLRSAQRSSSQLTLGSTGSPLLSTFSFSSLRPTCSSSIEPQFNSQPVRLYVYDYYSSSYYF